MNSISTPNIRSLPGWLLLLVLLFSGANHAFAQRPTVTDFKIGRPGGAYYTTSFTPATSSSDANAIALEVPTNTFRIHLEFSEAVIPTSGSNAKFDTKNEIADLLILKSGSSGTGSDLITGGTLTSTASDISHSADGKTITMNLKLAVILITGNTYTLTLDTNKVVSSAAPTKKARPFSVVFSTAKAISVLPTPNMTICNSGRARALPPIVINEG